MKMERNKEFWKAIKKAKFCKNQKEFNNLIDKVPKGTIIIFDEGNIFPNIIK